jgi:poly(3-hydroxybutyrate) depolymerase
MMSKLGIAGVLAAAILGAALSAGAAQAADPLPSYTVDKTKTSVSGLSSGAFMAVQFHTAYSGSVMGSAIVAGGPYNCAFVNLGGTVACMSGAPLASSSYAAAKSYEALGEIDPLSNFNTAQVYLYTGLSD